MAAADDRALRTLAEVKQEHIRLVLESVRGNKTKAAKILGIDRRSLYRIVSDKPEPKSPDSDR
jgi:DNA-binding protein Fis